MWIFTDTGFISIVRKPEYPDVLTVRARDRQSLEALAARANVEIKRSPYGDYPYRVFVGDGPFQEWFFDRGSDLKYENFKNQVKQTRGAKFASALGNVWVAMLAVQDEEARTPLIDSQGKALRHSDDVSPEADFDDLSPEQQALFEETFKDVIGGTLNEQSPDGESAQ